MVRPLQPWQRLFTAALKQYPVIGVRAFVTWHLGRPPTASESSSARNSANVLASAGGCQLQRVSLSRRPAAATC